MDKFCKNCGFQMNEAERFCPNCGTDNGGAVDPNAGMQQQNYNAQPNYNQQQPNYGYNAQPNYNNNTAGSGKWNPLAITSFVCSMVGIVIFGIVMGILAICFAAAAKNRAKSFPDERGKGLATAGLVVGIIEVVLVIIAWITAASALRALGF